MHQCKCFHCRTSSAAVPGEIAEIGSFGTLRGPTGEIIDGTVMARDEWGYFVDTHDGLVRVPYHYSQPVLAEGPRQSGEDDEVCCFKKISANNVSM